MELSSVNAVKLQSTDQKLTQKKPEETVTPEHGGGGIHIPDNKSDSVTLSKEAKIALEEDVAVTTFKSGGGVIRNN